LYPFLLDSLTDEVVVLTSAIFFFFPPNRRVPPFFSLSYQNGHCRFAYHRLPLLFVVAERDETAQSPWHFARSLPALELVTFPPLIRTLSDFSLRPTFFYLESTYLKPPTNTPCPKVFLSPGGVFPVSSLSPHFLSSAFCGNFSLSQLSKVKTNV